MSILVQENEAYEYPFLFVNQRYAWHGGLTWWENKLYEITAVVAQKEQCLYQEALRLLSVPLGALELVPYHSTNFGYLTSGARPARFCTGRETVRPQRSSPPSGTG